eukprot:TRINITY_DN7549_c0_g1_i1.p1 TRINITY_DN7549_c0_g1~~TRINITY_DN7549_c0_g1_i1.p1  ORF type:complete len:83 (-),score=14.96 TRINITY_DN7549_c0_g1_i1:44-292(-)
MRKYQDEFNELLRKSGIVSHDSEWRDMTNHFRNDECFKGLDKSDAFRVFDEFQRELDEKHQREEHAKTAVAKEGTCASETRI